MVDHFHSDDWIFVWLLIDICLVSAIFTTLCRPNSLAWTSPQILSWNWPLIDLIYKQMTIEKMKKFILWLEILLVLYLFTTDISINPVIRFTDQQSTHFGLIERSILIQTDFKINIWVRFIAIWTSLNEDLPKNDRSIGIVKTFTL